MTETTIATLFNQISHFLTVDPTRKLEGMLPTLESHRVVGYDSLVSFDTEQYHRRLLYQDQMVDAFLLTWLPGQGTRFHGHPERGCIYRVLQGSLMEERIVEGVIHSQQLQLGSCSYIDNTVGIHKVSNRGTVPAISLHFYAPAGFYTSNNQSSTTGTDIETDDQKQNRDSQDQDQDKN